MLSIGAVGSSGQADYYAKDDYYFGKGEGGVAKLHWGGGGALRLGVSGAAKREDFRAVLDGRNPDPDGAAFSAKEKQDRTAADRGEKPRPARDGRDQRAGIDLTFSAPKSVSLAVLLGGDERLLAAHEKAVASAMSFAERNFALTRVRNASGGIEKVLTGNLVWAQTTHSTSRAGDPNIHTHAVVANSTFHEGKADWRALDNREIFRNTQLIGQAYRAELARSAMALGYNVRDHARGTFELAGPRQSQLAAFSKRHDQFLANVEKLRAETGAQRERAVLHERPTKLATPEHELALRWRDEAREVGLDAVSMTRAARSAEEPGRDVTDSGSGRRTRLGALDRLGEQLARLLAVDRHADPYGYRKGEHIGARDSIAREAVSYGLQVRETGSAVFRRGEVLRHAFDHAPKGVTVDRLERELDRLVKDGRVVPADAELIGAITTQRSLQLEAEVVKFMKDGLGRAHPMYKTAAGLERVTPAAVARAGHDLQMNAGQTGAAVMILTSADRVVAVQGAAGVGKTTMFAVVARAAAEKGVTLYGLTPTHTAREAMTEATGLEAQTTAWFLARYGGLAEHGWKASPQDRAQWAGKSLVVDEASMLGNADAVSLMRISKALGIEKLVLVGDQRQHGSPSAGAPFRHLLNAETPHAIVDEIVRQRDDTLRGAVTHFSKGESTQGVKALGLSVVEVGRGQGDTALAGKAAELWSQARDTGVTRPVITVSQAQRALVNALILADLTRRGEIAPIGEDRTRLIQVHLSGPERWEARRYEEGQVLAFHSAYRAAGISKGEEVTITGRDFEGRQSLLTIEREDGRTATLNLRALGREGSEKFLVYEKRGEGPLHLGAALTWERTDKERGLFVGQSFTPVALADGVLTIRLASGRTRELAETDPQLRFVGPGYAMTSNRSQSLTLQDDPIGLLGSRNASQAGAYVQASRGVHGFTLVTDDRALLIGGLAARDGMNLIASEHMRTLQDASLGALMAAPSGLDGQGLPLVTASSSSKSKEEEGFYDPSLLRPEAQKSFVLDRPYTPDRSL